jgi:hypothetical protein
MISELTTSSVHPISNSQRWPYFFVSMATVFPLIVALGFIPDYIMISSGFVTPHWFTHVHGAIMASWLLMFFTQSFLAARGNLRYHKQLGLWGAALGGLVIVTLLATIIRRRFGIWYPEGSFVWDIFVIELYATALFILFFTWGIAVRKDSPSHKRLLLLATIIIMGAATDRIRFLPGDTPVEKFAYVDILIVPLFFYDYFTLRRIHRITIIGALSIIALQGLTAMAYQSPAWHKFSFSMFAPFSTPPIETRLTSAQINAILGDYGDKNWHLTIEEDHGKLYMAMPGQPKKELGTTSADELFVRAEAWRIKFDRGPDGKMIKMTNLEVDGIKWEVARYR